MGFPLLSWTEAKHVTGVHIDTRALRSPSSVTQPFPHLQVDGDLVPPAQAIGPTASVTGPSDW